MTANPNSVRNHVIRITVFADAAATDSTTRSYERTLPQIRDEIMRTTAATKAKLPWIKLARFGRITTKSRCLRHNANVRAITGIELDYDGKVVSFKQAFKLLRKLKCRSLIYASPSHTEAQPKWRILLPTSKEIWEPDIRRVLVGRVDGFFGGIFDNASYTLSQAYYFGAAHDNPAPNHQAAIIDGGFIDECTGLEHFDIPEVATKPHVFGTSLRQNKVYDPASLDPAMLVEMSANAGRGVSLDPHDCHAEENPRLKIEAALAHIPADIEYPDWFRIACAIHGALGDDGFDLFDRWSSEGAKYKGTEDCANKWKQCAKVRSIRPDTIYWFADQHDPGWRAWYKRLVDAGVSS
jgi:hypothetical protein